MKCLSFRERLDIWIKRGSTATAIELKYLTCALDTEVNGERFTLREQSAHDIRRYDIAKDIARVEAVIKARGACRGYVVVLTNDPNHWQPPAWSGAVDEAFRIHEGRVLTGPLTWGAEAGAGTTRGREQPIHLSGMYRCQWREYATVSDAPGGRFRYLCLSVGEAAATMEDFERVWGRIQALSGRTFWTKTGILFTCSAAPGSIRLLNTPRVLARSEFEKAYSRRPLERVSQLSDLQGPAYIYGILTDRRVTG